jgi:phosphotransferase system enzyme I (PtsI)
VSLSGFQLRGTGVSPGVAIGPALLLRREIVPVLRLPLEASQLEREVDRLGEAAAAARRQLQAIKERLAREVGAPHAYIFDAQLLMLEDPLLLERAVTLLRSERVNAEWALRLVSEELHRLFDEFTDEYLRERSSDLDDVMGRLQLNLAGAADAPSLSQLPGRYVLVADDLTPSEAAELDWTRVVAVAIDGGSRTHHTAILARSLGLPAVVGLRDATGRVPPGLHVVVDGTHGQLIVGPEAVALETYRVLQQHERAEELRLRETSGLPAVSRDGVAVRLLANAEFPEEAATARLHGAEGIGLFRSEYLLGRGRSLPSEEQQLAVYKHLLDEMRPHPVTVRLWDLGPEDLAPGGPSSANPALGQRALRLLPRAPEPFRVQLRALLRAARHGPLRIMLPFVSGPSELRAALAFVRRVRDELLKEGVAIGADVPVGVTLEVPSAALTADLLAAEAQFFSVGTNDLIQYLLAVDRTDPRVSALYEPLHPAVLRLLKTIVDAAGARDVPVAICGEMAGEPLQALALVGLGVRELSMTSGAIPRVKRALRGVAIARLQAVVERCLELAGAEEVTALLRQETGEPELLPAAASGVETEPGGGEA